MNKRICTAGIIVVVLFAVVSVLAVLSSQKAAYVAMMESNAERQISTAQVLIMENNAYQTIDIDCEEFEDICALFADLEKSDFQWLSKSNHTSQNKSCLYIRWTDQSELLLQSTDTENLYRISTDSETGRQLKGSYGFFSVDITELIDKHMALSLIVPAMAANCTEFSIFFY